jgi:hypothetical protein
MRIGLDYAWHGNLDPEAWKKDGISFVCRYLSRTASKNLTLEEAVLLSKAGLDIVVVWETTANEPLEGYTAGKAAATIADVMKSRVKMPEDRPVYFAVDCDVTAKQVLPYFDGINRVLQPDVVGVYGSYQVVEGIMGAGNARWGWQTSAWSRGKLSSKAHLYQCKYDYKGGGLDSADVNRALTDDFGQWRIQVSSDSQGIAPVDKGIPPRPGDDDEMTYEQFQAMMSELEQQTKLLHELRYVIGTNDSFRHAILVALTAGELEVAKEENDIATSRGIVTGLPAGWTPPKS